MIVPLCAGDQRCFGVLNLARAATDPHFTSKDLRLAKSVARQLGLAVENARLFSEVRSMAAQTRALHDQLRAVVDTVGFALLVVDSEGRVAEGNPQGFSLFRGSVLGLRWQDAIVRAPTQLAPVATAALSNALEGHETRLRAEEPDGRVWSVAAGPLPSGGATLAIQDLTEQEAAQREVARMRRLAEIGQMTAAIAHEIRNPLTGIKSAANLIRTNPDLAPEFGPVIEDECTKLSDLCDSFLDFAKPLQLTPVELKLGELARSIVDRHRAEFLAAGVIVDLEVDPAEGVVLADRARLEQAVRNLILNALQACERGDRVAVRVRGGTITVSDTGAGMAPETVERLFTPFFTTKAKGSGLGLVNVRKIVDAHGGAIRVRSTPTEGSTFELNLDSRRAA
jgi:signal transduction histidine kinase